MTHLLFGYGTLINKYSRLRTSETGNVYPATIKGFRRGWYFRVKSRSLTALGIVKDKDHMCNGVLIELNDEQLAKFDVREEDMSV